MKKTAVKFGQNNNIVGILCEPDLHIQKKNTAVIFLNSGLIHRIGQNRTFVHIANQLSENGFISLRFDFSGIGDSPASTEHLPFKKYAVIEARQSMTFLQTNTGTNKFIFVGLCAGAEVGFQTVIEDDRAIGFININGGFIGSDWQQMIMSESNKSVQIRYYKKNLWDINRWVKVISGKSHIFRVKTLKTFFEKILSIKKKSLINSQGQTQRNDPVQEIINNSLTKWQNIIDKNIKCLLIFSDGSNYLDIFTLSIANYLKHDMFKNIVKVVVVQDTDHAFTTLSGQYKLNSLIGEWINNLDQTSSDDSTHSKMNDIGLKL